MYCKEPVLQGQHWMVGDRRTVTQTFGNRQIQYEYLTGWWEYSNGAEGGDLELFLNKHGEWEVNDFDGAYDLPPDLKGDLRASGIVVDF